MKVQLVTNNTNDPSIPQTLVLELDVTDFPNEPKVIILQEPGRAARAFAEADTENEDDVKYWEVPVLVVDGQMADDA